MIIYLYAGALLLLNIEDFTGIFVRFLTAKNLIIPVNHQGLEMKKEKRKLPRMNTVTKIFDLSKHR